MQADMYLGAIDLLVQNGFEHYEISNYSKEGYEIIRDYCKQNDVNKNDKVVCPKCHSKDIVILKGDGRYINGLDEIAIICNECKKIYGFNDVKYYPNCPKEL